YASAACCGTTAGRSSTCSRLQAALTDSRARLRMFDNASKAFFHLLARSTTLQTIASRYGMRQPTSFARRFIAGETVEEAITAARTVQASGLLLTLDYLGESAGTLAAADAATRDYVRVIDAII